MKNSFKLSNKILNLSIYTFVFIFATSCNLDEEVISSRTTEDFPVDAEEVNRAVIGAYSNLYDVLLSEFSVTELRSDNTISNPDRSVIADNTSFTLDRFTLNTNNNANEAYYRACYQVIAFANRVIENLDVVEDEALRAQYQGEALFLRGLMHFNLVRLYGGVVIVDRILIGTEGFELSRSIESDVYEFIIEDLTAAVTLLPNEYDESEFGRATSMAARTILGKVYLTNNQSTEAITILEEVRDSGQFNLVPIYSELFEESNEFNEEIIFSVRYDSGQLGLGSPFPNLFAPLASTNFIDGVFGDGNGLNIPTQDMSDSYEFIDPDVGTIDPRKDASMADSWFDGNNVERLRKFVTKYNDAEYTAVNDAPADWIISRFADVLLMLSEAYINQGDLPAALTELNKVRARVGLAPLIDGTDITSNFDFRLALEQERRVEFAFENHRFFDLLRTGRAIAVINQHFATEFTYNNPDEPEEGANPISEFQLLLPIPQREIDLNPNLAQNVGY